MRSIGRREFLATIASLPAICNSNAIAQNAISKDEARKALEKAVGFFVDTVAKHGGYVYAYSDDLKHSQGEGVTGPDTVWVQPPGTPEVGMALLDVDRLAGSTKARDGAAAAARCLTRGQLHSGGWTDKIEFSPDQRKKIAYRSDGIRKKKGFDVSTFDDDKTQSAVRFLLHFDNTYSGVHTDVHDSLHFALDSILAAQYPNGGFAQGWSEPADNSKPADTKASYPETWSRTFPGFKEYWRFYTFNDGNIDKIIETLLLATRLTGDPRFRTAALRAGEFMIRAQMPDPQPAWAQQYDFEMKPVWARKFEPPSISGGESLRIVDSLMNLYTETGDSKFVEPIPKALDWFDRVALPDGRLARFYELKTDKPLYLTRDYVVTYDDSDLPTHYGFKVENRAKSLRRRYTKLRALRKPELMLERENRNRREVDQADAAQVSKIIQAMDQRGAWVEPGRIARQPAGRVIMSATFCKNVRLLATYVGKNG